MALPVVRESSPTSSSDMFHSLGNTPSNIVRDRVVVAVAVVVAVVVVSGVNVRNEDGEMKEMAQAYFVVMLF
jgi:hypothetical protein